MSGERVSVEGLSAAVMDCLEDYKDVIVDDMKDAVKKSAKTVQSEISANAPVRTGKYARSWATKTTNESAERLEVTVHSRNRYQLAHLLEHGHAKRNGGRVGAQVHIAPAEEKGIKELEQAIERSIARG